MPLVNEELKEKLRLKTLLVDTCALNIIRLHIKHANVQEFLETLDNIKCVLAIHDLVRAEYFRDANKKIELDGRKQFVDKLCKSFSLPVPAQVFKDATVFSYIYVRYEYKNISLVDLINSVLLKNYYPNLILLTENHKDFPITLHDRIGTLVFDFGKTLNTLGFYTVSPQKWHKEAQELLASPQWNSVG